MKLRMVRQIHRSSGASGIDIDFDLTRLSLEFYRRTRFDSPDAQTGAAAASSVLSIQ